MSEDLLSLWKDAVERTARFVVRDFPDVEREDVIQELFLFIIQNQERLKHPDQVGAQKTLARAAKEFAWDQRKQHLALSVQYSYRTSDVKAILETAFDHSNWENVRVPDDARSEFNDVFLEVNSDVVRAFHSLGHSQKKVIFQRFALGVYPENQTEVKRLYRAVAALTDKLNWYQKAPDSDFVGKRKVISNNNARYNIGGLT